MTTGPPVIREATTMVHDNGLRYNTHTHTSDLVH